MRKTKFYFGKRRLDHTWGLNLNKAGSLWVVPTILRGYFMRDYEAFCKRCGIRMMDNGQVGANVYSVGRHWSSSVDGGPIIHERSTRTTFYSEPQVGPVDAEGNPLSLTVACMTPAAQAFLDKIREAPAEPDPNPPVVPFVRYSDYDLPRSPEMEAVYQGAIARIEKES